MSACLMRVCASRCGFPSPPTAVAQSRGGGRIHQRWRRDGPITCGRSQRCGSIGCRHGLSHKRLKKRYRLMRMALSRCRALRERPGGLAEGVHTWFEGCSPAAWHDADGSRAVPTHAPKGWGTRPSTTSCGGLGYIGITSALCRSVIAGGVTRLRGTALIDAREFPQPVLNRG